MCSMFRLFLVLFQPFSLLLTCFATLRSWKARGGAPVHERHGHNNKIKRTQKAEQTRRGKELLNAFNRINHKAKQRQANTSNRLPRAGQVSRAEVAEDNPLHHRVCFVYFSRTPTSFSSVSLIVSSSSKRVSSPHTDSRALALPPDHVIARWACEADEYRRKDEDASLMPSPRLVERRSSRTGTPAVPTARATRAAASCARDRNSRSPAETIASASRAGHLSSKSAGLETMSRRASFLGARTLRGVSDSRRARNG